MRFGAYATLSLVTCHLLIGADYTDWKNTSLNGGDKVTIDYTKTPQAGVLTSGLTINNTGTVQATIKGTPNPPACGIVACFTTNSTFSGNGKINFTLQQAGGNQPAFGIKNATLTLQAGVGVVINGGGVGTGFNVSNGGLVINSDFSISGATTAINGSESSLTIDANGKTIDIRGNIDFKSATQQTTKKVKITLEGNNQKIQGNINVKDTPTEIKLKNGGTITGNFTGQGFNNQLTLDAEGANSIFQGNVSNNGTANINVKSGGKIVGNFKGLGGFNILTLKVEGANSIFRGNVENPGDTKIMIKDSGKLQGSVTASNRSLQIDLDQGTVEGGITSSAKTNTIDAKNNSKIIGNITANGGDTLKISLDKSQVQGITSSAKTNTIDAKNDSKIIGNISATAGDELKISLDKSQVQGNINTSAKANTITAKNDSTITGNIEATAGAQTLTVDLEKANMTGNITTSATQSSTITAKDSSSLSGGINTQAGAGATTITFEKSATLKNGTSNFESQKVDITFKDNAKTENEIFNLNNGRVKIDFKGSAELSGGGINTNNGTTSEITFENSAKATNNSTIKVTGGTSTLTFKDTAKLEGSTVQTDGGTHKIDFKTNAEANNSKIITNGGTSTVSFGNNTKMTGGTVSTTGGTLDFTAKDDANLSGNFNQTGGTATIDFKNNSKLQGNISQNSGTSTITFNDKSTMTGNIEVKGGETNITFTGQNAGGSKTNPTNAQITGNITAAGSKNTVTFTEGTKLDGKLTLDGFGKIDGKSTATITGAQITKGIQGYDDVNLKIKDSQIEGGVKQETGRLDLTATNTEFKGGFEGTLHSSNKIVINQSKLEGGVKQDTGRLDLTATETKFKGGFEGTSHSNNKIVIDKSELKGGVKQNTGSLELTATETKFDGGFIGINSSNLLKIANGSFGSGDIKQTGGSLKAEIISLQDLGKFIGENSQNVIHLARTEIKDISQSGGGLEFLTDSKVDGTIKGTNRSQNKISVIGANVTGDISQDTGSMQLTLNNGEAKNISAKNATFGFYATDYKATSIKLENATANGNSNNFKLTGEFNQTGGTSNLTFAASEFKGITKLNNTISSSLIFTNSKLQNVEATNGRNSITLSDGSMGNFTGTGGTQGVTMTNSKAKNFTQTNGSLTLNASAKSEVDQVTGTGANLSLTFNVSKVIGKVSNSNGNTTLSLQDSEIGGDVTQTNGAMNLVSTNSKIKGGYTQTGGTFTGNLTKSSIEGNASFSDVTSALLNLNQSSTLAGGLKSVKSTLSFSLQNQSSIKVNGTLGALTQDGGRVIGSLDQSSIAGSIDLRNGITELSLANDSKITGNINSTNNETTILLDHSQIEGNITVDRKFLHLTAQNQSTIKSPQLKLNNADLKLILDTQSKFIGALTQTNNKQDIIIKQDSLFQGDITNNNTTSNILINHSTLEGKITQTGGSLTLEISNEGKVTSDIDLNSVTTTLAGTGNGNQIGGNFTQTDGSVTGSMNGLTLKGKYSQIGGTSSVTFTNSSFEQETMIKNATNSSLTFDHSKLKAYTTDGGNNNTLKLLNGSEMAGDLTLKNGAQTLLKMDNSTITGSIKGTDNSTLTLDTLNSTITGDIDFKTGGVKGSTNQTKINGSIKLEGTTSDVSFTNGSLIGGDLKATGAASDNIIKLDASRINGEALFEGGKIKLDLSNGSSIGGNLTFKSTKAHLTGSPAGNKIEGNFLSEGTALTGNISSLTLHGTFTQQKGTSDIIFRDNSLFKGRVTISEATSSYLQFLNGSGVRNEVTITKGDNNKISLGNQSFIEGNIELKETKAKISASNGSSITGNITASTAKDTDLNFDSSTLTGNITQTDGDFKLKASNQSLLKSNISLKDTQGAKIDLFAQSALEGSLALKSSDLIFGLDDSRFNTLENPQELKAEDSSLTLSALHNSIFGANLKSSSTTGNHRNTMSFLSSSAYSGTMELSKVKTEASFNESSLFSDSIKVSKGSFDLSFTNSKFGGLVKAFETEEAEIKIKLKDKSEFQIQNASLNGGTLDLLAEDNSRLRIDLLSLENTKATYEARTNGNLNVNTQIKDTLSTLKVNIQGGIFQGSITQDIKAPNIAEVRLKSDGNLGGRWIVTDDSQIKSLTLENQEAILASREIFTSPFKSALTFVDFTMDFEDRQTSSRIGKELVLKPTPQPGQPIPPPGANQSYARELYMQNLSGTHGLFRVYADLGTKLADKIVAETASGEHLIQVYYRVDTFRDIGGDRIVVAKVTDPTTTVSFQGTQSEVGLTRYDTEIIKENSADGRGFEWIIGQATPSGMSYSAKIIASILQSQYRVFAVETDSLDRRLGGLDRIERDKGFWVRSFIGEASKDSTDYSTSTTDKYFSIWSGFDYNSIGLTGHNFLGGFLNYTGMETENKDYTGKLSSFAFGIYNVFKAYSGFYFDVLAKYIYTTNQFEISSYALAKNKPEFDNHKFLASLEMGHTFYLGEKRNSLYIQPQFQISSGYIQGASTRFVDVTGELIRADLGHNAPAMMRLGVFVGKNFNQKIKINLKGGTSLAYDINSGGNLIFEDSSTQLKIKQKGDFRMLFSAHSDFEFANNFRMYASFDTSFFGSYNTIFNLNLGLRFVFGKRNNLVTPVPMVYNPYEPIPQLPDDKRTIPVVKTYTTQDIQFNYKGKNREVPIAREEAKRVRPYQGYAPQPSMRKSYRDSSLDLVQEVDYR